MTPLRMGDCAAAAQWALISGTMEAMQASLGALPAKLSAKEDGTAPTAAQVLRTAGKCAYAFLGTAHHQHMCMTKGVVADLFSKCSVAMLQAAALSRLALLIWHALGGATQREWPLRHTASEGHTWAATLAATASAAAFWAREASNSVAASLAYRSGCSSSADAETVQHIQQRSQEWQLHQCMQHAALHLATAIERLLPPAATASLDALEQEAVPSLLTALAEVCRITPESVRQYSSQVLQYGSRPTAQACAWQALDLSCAFA
jgi:hypothetical protein